jgi:hypothetical protein
MHVDAMRKQRNLYPCATASPLSYGTAKPTVRLHHRLRRASTEARQQRESAVQWRRQERASSGMTAKPYAAQKILMK